MPSRQTAWRHLMRPSAVAGRWRLVGMSPRRCNGGRTRRPLCRPGSRWRERRCESARVLEAVAALSMATERCPPPSPAARWESLPAPHAPAPVCRPADHERPAPGAAQLHDEVAAAAVSARPPGHRAVIRPPSSRGLTTQHMCGPLAWKRENRLWMEDATSFRKQTRSCLCQAMMRACARRSGVQRL